MLCVRVRAWLSRLGSVPSMLSGFWCWELGVGLVFNVMQLWRWSVWSYAWVGLISSFFLICFCFFYHLFLLLESFFATRGTSYVFEVKECFKGIWRSIHCDSGLCCAHALIVSLKWLLLLCFLNFLSPTGSILSLQTTMSVSGLSSQIFIRYMKEQFVEFVST